MFKFIKSDVSIDLRETKGSEVYKLESHSKLFKIIDNHDIPLNLSLNSNNEFLTIKTNNQLHILNASENSLHTTINLDCEPELSSFNKNNSFLVVGDRKGTLHFIHVKTKNFILSKDMHIDKCQDENENFFKKLKFVKAESKVKKSEELIVALNNFTLVRFSNIDFSRIETALNSGNFDEALSAKQAICTEIVQMTNFTKINDLEHNCAVDFSESSVLDRTYIAGSGREPLQIYKTDNKTFKTSKVTCVSRALKGKEIKKIRIRENLMILLTSNREISIWDPVRLFFLKRINFKSVKDFCFYEEKLLVLTKTLDGNVCNLKLLSLMDSAENFSTVVGNFNGGITCVNSTADENCWLDDGANNNGVWFLETQYANSGISIAVQFLCESKPFVKFQNLVQAKKYEDAKRIALEFGLDTQIVEEARLNEVLKNEKSHHDDEYLINLLKEIKNISFSINFCLSIQCDSQNSTYRFLEYALNTVKTTGLEYSDLRTVVVKTIKKFGTFILLHCNKTMNELVLKDENFDANEWQKFRSLDLLELLKDFFRLGKLSEGILVWRRHNLDENLIDFIDEILEALSNEVAPYLYLNWLKTEVFPFLNDIESRTKIAIWVEKRARMVERLEQNPSNALKICKLLILEESVPKYKPKTPLKFVERTFINHEYQEDEEDDNGVKGTKKTLLNQNLIEELENLCYLREKHDFQLSLIDYTQSTPASIAFELLDRVVNFEFLKEEIERHFKPYAKKMNLNPEELLCEYCMEVMENVVTDSIPLVVEDRILAVIDCVQGNDSKIEIVLEFLGRCSIPWSSNVQNLIDKAFEWVSEKKKEDLAEHYRLIKVKGMLMKYGLNFFNIQDYSFTKSMILVQSLTTACFLGLLGYITNRLDVVDAIEDAILIVSVYLHVDKFDAYTMRLKKLAYNGEVHRILNLLKNLTEEGTKFQFDSKLALEVEGGLTKTDALTLGQKLLCWIVEIIDHQVDKFAKLKNISGDDENENFNFEILVKNNTLDFSKEKLKHLNLLKVAKEVCAFLLRLQDDGMNSDYQADLNIQSIPFYSENHNFIIGSAVCSLEKDCGNNVKSKPQAVALDFNSTFITNESLKNLSNLINLMLEFNILFGWSKYQDIKLRRILLRKFAKTVFTTNSEETNIGKVPSSKVASDKSQSALYRLAELLGYERSSLKGILAEEAASCGDFQIALFICKELFENFPNEETSKVLKTVSKLLVQFSSFHKNIFSDLKDDFKFTSRMLLLSQQALLTCSVDSLSDSLDTFKNLELQHSIFTQCEAGNYKMLIEKSSKKTGFNQNAIATSSKFAFTPSEPNPEDEVTNFKDKYASNLFEEHYKANGLVLNTATAMSLTNDFIMDIINSNMEMKSENSLFEVPLTYLLNSNFRSSGKKNKAISVDPVQQGKILVDYLKKNRNLFAALRSLNRSIEARWRWQFDDVFISERDTVAKENVEIIQHTLNNVLSSRYIDQKLALGLMFALPTAKAFESIKHSLGITGIDYALTIKVANIGTTAAVVWGQRQFQVQCMALAMQSKWYYQFRLLGIPFDERAFQSSGVSGDYQRTLVSIFLEKSSMDVLAALEFARNYNIEDDFVLFEYLKMLLLSPNDYGGYQSKIIGLVDDIVNQSKLLAVLEELYLNRISPYDYERIKFVIKLILKIDPEQEVPKRKLAILEIIWNYRRQFPPMLDELVDAKERLTDAAVIENYENLLETFPMSTFRFPFHALSAEDQSALLVELNESSLPQLYALYRPLNLAQDWFYIKVVEKMILQLKIEIDNSETIPITSHSNLTCNNLKFSDFKPLLIKIKDSNQALQLSVKLAEQFSNAVESINTYKLALNLAERALAKTNEQEEKLINQLENAIDIVQGLLWKKETEYQLLSNNCGDLMEFLTEPTNLITQFYLQKSELGLEEKEDFDLHGIVDEIAARYNLDVQHIRESLIKSWLMQNIEINENEKKKFLPSMQLQSQRSFIFESEKHIENRIIYLLKSQSTQKSTQLLMQVALSENSKVSKLARVRSLNILLRVSSFQEIAAVNKKFPGSTGVRNYLQQLLYLADFEELRIIQDRKDFVDCDKGALVRSLWINHGDEDQRVTHLICNICMDYEIYDQPLWEKCLLQLQNWESYEYLLCLLEHISSKSELSQLSCLPSIWNEVLLNSLLKLNHKNTDAFEQIIALIHKCPFVPELKIELFVEYFANIYNNVKFSNSKESYLMAIRGLSALSSPLIVNKIQQILSVLKTTELSDLLDLLFPERDSDNWLFDMSVSRNVVSNLILRKILSDKLYKNFLNSRHLQRIATFAIENQEFFSELLIDANNFDAKIAEELIFQYFKHHPEKLIEIKKTVGYSEDEELKDKSILLQGFLECNKIIICQVN